MYKFDTVKNSLLILFLLAVFFTFAFSFKLKQNEFTFIGDQFYRFSLDETNKENSFLIKPVDFGVYNNWELMIQYWDSVFYKVAYTLGVDFISAEKLVTFLTLLLCMIPPFFGFIQLQKLFNWQTTPFHTLIPTLWYAFNPYTLILWHGGVLNVGSALTYGLFPLTLCYFHKTFFSKNNSNYDPVALAFLCFLTAFTFWIFAPLIFFLTVYAIIFTIKSPKITASNYKKIGLFLIIFSLLTCHIAYVIILRYLQNSGYNNSEFSPTFGHLIGGLKYQLMMRFSWGIYTVWHPRALYSFGEFFFSRPYRFAVIFVYVIALFGVIKRWKSPVWPFVIILMISLFFAKGEQPPFGEVFTYMYNSVPFFSVFRTPDIRFGFLVVFCLGVLILAASKYFNLKITVLILVPIFIILNRYFFDGTVVYGQEIPGKYYDRIVQIPDDYTKVQEFFRNKTGSFYIAPFPPIAYGNFLIDKSEHHVSQDLLPKLIKQPFVYADISNSMYTKTYKYIVNTILDSGAKELSESTPISYYIVRNDISCSSCVFPKDLDNSTFFVKELENNTFKIFQAKSSKKLVETDSGSVGFTVINPTKILLRISPNGSTDSKTLTFFNSYSRYWGLYQITDKEAAEISQGTEFTSALLFFSKYKNMVYPDESQIFNKWIVEASDNDQYFIIDYWTQNIYSALQLISAGTLIVVFVFWAKMQTRKKYVR